MRVLRIVRYHFNRRNKVIMKKREDNTRDSKDSKDKKLGRGGKIFKKRPCRLCKDKTETVDFKDIGFLGRFVSDRGRIISSRITGNCAKHQRVAAKAIKQARLAALLPYVRIKEGLPRRRPRREA